MSFVQPSDESRHLDQRPLLGSDYSQRSWGLDRSPLLPLLERRKLWHVSATTIACALLGSTATVSSVASAAAMTDEEMVPVLKTASGLKYIDLVPGTGPSPAYGNLVSIAYKAYIKLPPNSKSYNTEPQQYDNVNRYLLKHGNGRTIAGLDEGLHTMKVGGKRRILIPPKLGFVDVGLGPLPVGPINRYRLNQLLDQMVELSGGTVIYEVTLLSVIPDEADQGYYSDASLSPEDFATLRENLRIKGNQGRIEQRAAEAAAVSAGTGQDRVR
jgi:FKBP-type peptidyl-prolyl cis-trans isomerase